MDFKNASKEEIQKITKAIEDIKVLGEGLPFEQAAKECSGLIDETTIKLSLEYQAYLAEQNQPQKEETISSTTEKAITVMDMINAMYEGKFRDGEFDEANPNEDEANLWALIQGIYLYFGEANRRRTFYDLDNPIESTLFQIYHDTCLEYDSLHSTHGRMTLEEGIAAFDENRYKEGELPLNFHSIASVGNMILERVEWVPEKLWSAKISQKHARELLAKVSA